MPCAVICAHSCTCKMPRKTKARLCKEFRLLMYGKTHKCMISCKGLPTKFRRNGTTARSRFSTLSGVCFAHRQTPGAERRCQQEWLGFTRWLRLGCFAIVAHHGWERWMARGKLTVNRHEEITRRLVREIRDSECGSAADGAARTGCVLPRARAPTPDGVWPAPGLVDTWLRAMMLNPVKFEEADIQPRVRARGGPNVVSRWVRDASEVVRKACSGQGQQHAEQAEIERLTRERDFQKKPKPTSRKSRLGGLFHHEAAAKAC